MLNNKRRISLSLRFYQRLPCSFLLARRHVSSSSLPPVPSPRTPVRRMSDVATKPAERPWRTRLPFLAYPTATDTAAHGLCQLWPASIPVADFAAFAPFREPSLKAVPFSELTRRSVVAALRGVAGAFATREPTVRWMQPALLPTPGFDPQALVYCDALSPPDDDADDGAVVGCGDVPSAIRRRCEAFGPLTRANIFFWFARLSLAVRRPCPPDAVAPLNGDTMASSVALYTPDGALCAAFVCHTQPSRHAAVDGCDAESRHAAPIAAAAAYDAFDAVQLAMVSAMGRFLEGLAAMALPALCERFPTFAAALAAGRVAHCSLLAVFGDDECSGDGHGRSATELPPNAATEAVAAALERLGRCGFRYAVTEASSAFTGAAFLQLGALAVAFAPYQAGDAARVPCAAPPGLLDACSTPNGWLSEKDSGTYFMVVALPALE